MKDSSMLSSNYLNVFGTKYSYQLSIILKIILDLNRYSHTCSQWTRNWLQIRDSQDFQNGFSQWNGVYFHIQDASFLEGSHFSAEN